MFKKVVQRGRSKRRGVNPLHSTHCKGRNGYPGNGYPRYVEPLSDAITRCIARATGPRLEAFFNILLGWEKLRGLLDEPAGGYTLLACTLKLTLSLSQDQNRS